MELEKLLKITLIQPDVLWENPDANFKHFGELTKSVEKEQDLLLFPETCSTGFTMKSNEFAEKRNGASESFFLKLATDKKAFVGGGWIESNSDGLPYNTFSIASPEGLIVCRYRKIHPFSPGNEDIYYSGGNEIVNITIGTFKLTPFICYDLRFPEIFRLASGQTDIFLIIGNWPSERIAVWNVLLKARAIENVAFVAGVNRVGFAGRKNPIGHNGYSGFFSPDGSSSQLETGKEGILSMSFSNVWLEKYRKSFPYLKDRKF